MLQKFELVRYRTNDMLHLQLLGEFDGSSASKLAENKRGSRQKSSVKRFKILSAMRVAINAWVRRSLKSF